MICAYFAAFHISVQLCVFSACWVTPGTLRSYQYPALAPRGPRGFLLGYVDKLNCFYCGWHRLRCTLNTKRPWAVNTFFCRFVSYKYAHKQHDIAEQTLTFRWTQLAEKAPNPDWNLDQKLNPQLWGILSDSLWGMTLDHCSLPHCTLFLFPTLPCSLISLQLTLSNFGQLFHDVKKGEEALILPIMPQSVHLLCRSD